MAKRPKAAQSGPGPSLLKLARKLFANDSVECEAFIQALAAPEKNPARATQSAIVVTDPNLGTVPFMLEPSSSWMPPWTFRLSGEQRPGLSHLHDEGLIYCLDLSSIFEASVLQSIGIENSLCLDLCASPGGKSIFASRALQYSSIVSNEVIGKRTAPLISNLKRCKVSNAIVTSLDPSRFKDFLADCCGVVIVDAPCSGQSLLARGKHSPGCFHPSTVRMNAGRQKRILGCAASLVREGGYIAYMTCTFSREENEEVVEWFLKKNPDFSTVEVSMLGDYQSHLSDISCYRMWPQRGEGCGGFTSLLVRSGSYNSKESEWPELPYVWRSEAVGE